jgi:hypothetical protein
MTNAEHHQQATEIEGALRLDRYLLNLRSGDEISVDDFAELVGKRSDLLAAHIFGPGPDRRSQNSPGLPAEALLGLRNDLSSLRLPDDRLPLCELAARHVHSVLAAVVGRKSGRTTSQQPAAEFGATEIITDIATNDSTIDPEQLGAWLEFQKSLARLDPGLKRLVDLLFFDGLSAPLAAQLLGLPEATVRAGWKTAKVKLAMAGADLLSD